MNRLLVIFFMACMCFNSLALATNLYWPTEDKSFFQGATWETLIQPTISGKLESGTFGCVRNNGSKFHEGIDIKAKKRNKKGEAIDKVVAAMDGQVVYTNSVSGNSSYGKYIVILHDKEQPAIYSLYAHLSSIDPCIKVGKAVKGGDSLGIMGRTAMGTGIPKERAHLHFEMGVMLSGNEGFTKWYDKQKFTLPNKHGLWNGFNLTGFDALDFYEKWRSGKIKTVQEYFNQIPIAFSLRIPTCKIPDYVERYPSLVMQKFDKQRIEAWDIDFTWFAMPIRWTAIYNVEKKNINKGMILKAYNNNILNEHNYKDGILIKQDKSPVYGKALKKTVDLLFDY